MQLIDFFDKGAEAHPDRPFLIDECESRTFRDVRKVSHRIANAFRAADIAIGAKAAVFSPNAARAFECVIGTLRAGCVWVPVNTRNALQENIYILNDADVEILFFHGSLEDSARQFRLDCPKIRHSICIDRASALGPSLEEWTGGQPEQSKEIDLSPLEMATLAYTGGTTGRPKGVMMSHLGWETSIASWAMDVPCDDPVHLVAAPMTHAAGNIALQLMQMGTTNVILPAFDPVRVMEAIERQRVTYLFLPPTAIYMMLAHPDVRKYDYSSLRHFVYAAAPMSVEKLKEAISVFGNVMAQGYAQTEAIQNLTYLSPKEHLVIGDPAKEHRLLSCGKPRLQVRLEILDDHGNVLPANSRGEICVKTNLTMLGYYKDPEQTAAVSAFGWHHTGDIGYKDEDGYLYIADRKKDMIISGGFNIYPSEIEQVLWKHPAVHDCAVIGVPDEKWGEAVKAVVEPKPGMGVDVAELEAMCRAKLSRFKVPKSFEVWPELPRSPVGKVLKRAVRDRFWQGKNRMV